MCRCIYMHLSQHVVSSRCCAQEVDNNLQIYSRQICLRRRARASWKARHHAASYFINYNEGYTAPSLNIHETQPPSCLCSRDRPNLFTPTPGLARFAEEVNYVQNLRRAKRRNNYICAHCRGCIQYKLFDLIYVLFPLCITV